MPFANLGADDRCPCGTGLTFGECCGPLHAGDRSAPTALALMRSRFTAFVAGNTGYLLASWHPSTRPAALDLDEDVRWLRLDILDTLAGGPFDREGIVEFEAFSRVDGERRSQRERSRFRREPTWLYVDAV
ncbi:YchJ family protein [Agromyces seonyuensis]|uniref:UPF0225 protein GB864_05930 n=1 Tax=Agromyces seonyuensis TaxID=2662446 RepID=A0A6I4NUM6_9MICO|nr:YchJ family metal-binding protein [Agromyces seonyuensis]MWB98088.1 hypothetical protein [Agromyces seonyuensis]